jgi:hypothetical protein
MKRFWIVAMLVLVLGTATTLEGNSMKVAKGTFDVKVAPVALDGPEANPLFGRFSLEKSLHGDLEATGQVQMLTAGTEVKTSAAYVAIERVEGTLHGRRGSFALQHRGIMTATAQQLEITVVPDSGTGELLGLEGTFKVNIDGGKHFYEFEYQL